MDLTPEMIDAAVIQLRGIFATAENIPDYVKEDGEKFLSSLDRWSEEKKKALANA